MDYLETTTKKLYTKREIKANISWSSTEYDIYNPQFTDSEENSNFSNSQISDKFYLESEEELEEQNTSENEFKSQKISQMTKIPKLNMIMQNDNAEKLKVPKFSIVISDNSSSEWQSEKETSDSLIKINDCTEEIKVNISSSTNSSPENLKRSYVRIGSNISQEDQESPEKFNLQKTQDFREIVQNDNIHARKNKHFISLKKIRQKGKVGIAKKWGNFYKRKVEERMKRDSELSTKDQQFKRHTLTNRAKNPLNVSLNITNNQNFNQHPKLNFSFHSRYKEDSKSGISTRKEKKYSRLKNSSLVRGSKSQKKRYRSRQSSHCLKTGLFGVINNTDNIYSVQNRRITIDSTDSIKNKSFFPADNLKNLGRTSEATNNIQLKINSTLGRTKSRFFFF